MSVGIGIITCNRAEMLIKSIKQHELFSKNADQLFIYNDSADKKGIAYGKNRCIKALSNHDYIFLFDDDCYPIKEGWIDFMIEMHEASSQHHFLFMDKRHHKYVRNWSPNSECEIELYNDCGGVFMSMTKHCIDKIGYLDSRYKLYGYEHAGYSRRVHLSRLNAKPFMMPVGLNDYLYAVDYNDKIDSALPDEVKYSFIEFNDGIYHDELKNWHNLKRESYE